MSNAIDTRIRGEPDVLELTRASTQSDDREEAITAIHGQYYKEHGLRRTPQMVLVELLIILIGGLLYSVIWDTSYRSFLFQSRRGWRGRRCQSSLWAL